MAKPVQKVRVKILSHPGNPTHLDEKAIKSGQLSGVQTSEGDKFHGDIVTLPEDEATLLIGAKRAKLYDAEEDGESPRRGRQGAEKTA